MIIFSYDYKVASETEKQKPQPSLKHEVWSIFYFYNFRVSGSIHSTEWKTFPEKQFLLFFFLLLFFLFQIF